MKKYDFIIIGAGLSGCVLGYLLRKQNKKVLIVEHKKIKNKSKLCGGLLTQKSYNLLNDIYDNDIKELDFISHHKSYIVNNNKKIEFDISLYTIYRKELDDFVLDKYLKLDGEILENTSFSDINISKKEILINNNIYNFEYLIGADGVLSSVRKKITKKNQEMNFALENNFNIDKKDLAVYFFDNLKSYGWIIPNNKYTMVGIGDVSGKVKLDQDYTDYLKQIGIENDNSNKRGAFLPSGKDILLESDKCVKYIGDAGGLISPITGEGIYYAINSAKTLSEDFINYKKNMKKIIKEIRSENFYKKFVYNYKLRNFIFDRETNRIFRKIIDKFANKIL